VTRAALVALLAAALAGRGGGGSPPRPATHVVEMRGFAFSPASLAVAAGDTVVWKNSDILPHTATAGRALDSGSIAAGAEWRWVAVAGEYAYHCAFHPTMLGTASVSPSR
jgi:plastocyanin